jgi:GTPase SAR1 family protein
VSIPWRKICLLGDHAVGKTSLVRRFAYNMMEPRYIPSAGCSVSSKTVVVARLGMPAAVTLLLWDPASASSSDLPLAGFLSGADVVLIVCDVTREETVQHLAQYIDHVHLYAPKIVPAIVVNKVDLPGHSQQVLAAAMSQALQLQAPLFQVSAHANLNVERAFRTVASMSLHIPRARDDEN